ncbi:hypothetical protein C8R47DRAFT_1193529 [Mycena vitilis]|nr:hypothetical protein C8R47DRAFT_1193529 [Mycena vitilis]
MTLGSAWLVHCSWRRGSSVPVEKAGNPSTSEGIHREFESSGDLIKFWPRPFLQYPLGERRLEFQHNRFIRIIRGKMRARSNGRSWDWEGWFINHSYGEEKNRKEAEARWASGRRNGE